MNLDNADKDAIEQSMVASCVGSAFPYPYFSRTANDG